MSLAEFQFKAPHADYYGPCGFRSIVIDLPGATCKRLPQISKPTSALLSGARAKTYPNAAYTHHCRFTADERGQPFQLRHGQLAGIARTGQGA
jgi:hypothetical protein